MSNYRLPVKHLVYKMLVIFCIQLSLVGVSNAQFEVSVSADISCNSAVLTLSQSGGSGVVTYKIIDPSGNISINIPGPTRTVTGGGIYIIRACDDNGESDNQVSVEVPSPGVSLEFTQVVTNEICGGDGEIMVNMTAGIESMVELLQGGVVQSTIAEPGPYTFSNLIAGDYRIRVSDVCLNVQVADVTLDGGASGLSFMTEDKRTEFGLIDCDELEVEFELTAPLGTSLAPPYNVEYTFNPPTGTLPPLTFSTSNSRFQNTIPFFTNEKYTYSIKVVDRCGVELLGGPYCIEETFNVEINETVLGCGRQGINIIERYGKAPYTHTLFDPSGNEVDIDEPLLMDGVYTLNSTDACGTSIVTNYGYVTPILGDLEFEVRTAAGCDIGFGSASIRSRDNARITSWTITSGPISNLPVTYTNTTNRVITGMLPAGTYSIDFIDECDRMLTESIEIPSYSGVTGDITIVNNCGSFDLSHNYTDNYTAVSVSPPSTPTVAVQFLNGSSWTTVNSSLNAGVEANFSSAGMYRLVRNFSIWESPLTRPCGIAIDTFEYTGLTLIGAVRELPCVNGASDVFVEAVGVEPLMYSIVPGFETPTTNPMFSGLGPGTYTVNVEDVCGNMRNQVIEITGIITPEITEDNVCLGEDVSLRVIGFDFLSFEWSKTSDPATILSTTPILNLPDFSEADQGTYSLNMSFTGSCFDRTIERTITLPELPDAGLDNMTELCTASGTLDLFDYIGGSNFDLTGTWTDADGTSVNNLVNYSDLPVGPSVYTYTVTDVCGQTDTSMITITITAPAVTCMAQDISVMLDDDGEATITTAMIDNGSTSVCSTPILSLSQTEFDCDSENLTIVALTVSDGFGTSASCTSTVTVEDSTSPLCSSVTNLTFDLRPLQCDTTIILPIGTDNCGTPVSAFMSMMPQSNVFDIGVHNIQYIVTDNSDNTSICDLSIRVNGFVSSSFTCINQINLSLDPMSCEATLTPAMLLTNSDYGCLESCDITVTDALGHIINRNFNLNDAGQVFSYEICCGTNCCTGNVLVEYKAAPLILCPENDTVSCGSLDVLGVPTATARCGGGAFEVFLLDEVRVAMDCDPDYTGVVTRTYRAIDELSGNFTDCTHTIHLERVDFDGIKFPEDASIACNDPNYIFNNDGFPIPYISGSIPTGSGSAGVPIICMPKTGSGTMGTPNNIGFAFAVCGSGSAGVPLLPIDGATIATADGPMVVPSSFGQVCSAAVIFNDIPLPSTPCRKKVMRTFEVREWFCGRDSSRFGTQIIEVVDTVAPTFVCPESFTVSSDEYCEVMVDFPSVDATDGCSNGIIVQIDPDGSPIVNSNGGRGMLQSGVNLVTYTVRDSCYNSSTCSVAITVQDQVEPVAICESHTTVALSTAGNTFLNAESLDDGSWDGCGIDRFEVRRMTTDCNPMDTLFGQRIEFCCTDAGAEVIVVFRVYDKSGNVNDCMVSVSVQDKLPSTLECPLSLNVDCRVPFDRDTLSIAFGEAKLIGDCSSTDTLVEIPDFNINQCNIGTITRTFNLLGDDRLTILFTCKQLVTITNDTPFVPSNIQWPLDYSPISGVCSIDEVNPEDLDPQFAYPSFLAGDDQCSMLGFSHEDILIMSNLSGQCFRIERTWSVINWCDDTGSSFAQFTDPNGPQIIDVRNTIAPTTDAFDPILVESQFIDCTSGLIEFTRSAASNCMDSIDWSYVVRDLAGVQVASADTNAFSEVLNAGEYTIGWTISDGCNNTIVQNQMLTVRNTKAPTPVCMNNLTVELDTPIDTDGDGINDQEIRELWASDFDGGSYQACNNPITLSISPDPTETNITFTCDSIGMRTVRLYVTDNVTMAQDYCSLTVTITDGGMCGDNLRVIVEGDIFTEDFENVEDVEVSLINGDDMQMTDSDGHYAFGDMPMGGQYIISPNKDVDYLNGVSTLDLVHIQRHILNIQELDSPYKLIAADINDSHSITAIDLIELRKLILGVNDELPHNTSWRFVDAAHQFVDALNPWVFDMPEDYFISQLQDDMSVDFIGVKIGDVNGSVIANLHSKVIENRASRWPLSFTIEEKILNEGLSEDIAFYSDSYERISGWQMTLEYDSKDIEVERVVSEILDLDQSHFNIVSQDEGWITISYNSEEPIDIDPSQPIFGLVVKAKRQLDSDNLLSITSKVTPSEAYRGLNEIVDLQLRAQEVSTVSIVSARPNPWKDYTDIEFVISEDGPCKWEVYDVNGRLVYAYGTDYNAGTNNFRIDRTHLPTAGVYYLKLITEHTSADYKLMVLE